MGSPMGATFCSRTAVRGISPISNRRQRRGPSPPTAVMTPDSAGLLVHGDAGEVAHVLVGAGELVEQGGFSAVLVSGKGEDHASFTSTSMLRASSFRRDRE